MIALTLFCFQFLVAFSQEWQQPPPSFPETMSFEDWKKFFAPKGYQSLLEHEDRRRAFENNVAFIENFNAKNTDMRLGVNQFSAMTHEEFRKTILMQPLNNDTVFDREEVTLEVEKELSSVDWVSRGAVTPVKNQGQCGSCWSFSATGAVEGCVQISTGKLISLSEQELVSCSSANHGCSGGWPTRAFDFINQNGGINTEANYPYTASNAYCNSRKKAHKVSVTHTHVNVRSRSDSQLVAALSRGPVSVLIDASDATFQHYRGGVFRQSCGTRLDHAVLAVGYDSQSYKVKNSWGTWWGESGYIRFQRQQGDNGYGQCGILLQPSQPTQCELVGHQPDPQPIPTQKPTRTPPHPPTPSQKHSYADPSIGCLEGETPLKVKYVDGQYCAPECTHASCPDAPIGVRGIASCGYRDQDVAKNYCGIFCNPNYPGECDSDRGFTCKPYGQTGICTYDNAHGDYWLSPAQRND